MGVGSQWAFGVEQLSLVPWAGTGRDAYYERASGSIKFFSYEPAGGRRILTALSRDIVAHEAAHAIVDAVAPDLNDAADPDSLTIHEAVGDLSALMQTLVDERMLFSAYALFGGDVDGSGSTGEARGGVRHRRASRRGRGRAAERLERRLVRGRGDKRRPGVDRSDPHEASGVVVGALFAALRERTDASARDFERAVLVAGRELARIVVPA